MMFYFSSLKRVGFIFLGSCHFRREILCTSFGRSIRTGMRVNIMEELVFSLGAMLRYVGSVGYSVLDSDSQKSSCLTAFQSMSKVLLVTIGVILGGHMGFFSFWSSCTASPPNRESTAKEMCPSAGAGIWRSCRPLQLHWGHGGGNVLQKSAALSIIIN